MQRVLIKEKGFLECDRNMDYNGGKLSLEQLTPNQMGSSRTPTCRMKNNLLLSPLTLYNSQQLFIVFKNLCCRRSFGVVNLDCRSTRRYSLCTASQNCSATRRLLLFTTNLIISFRAQHTATKGKDQTFWRFAKWVRRFSDLNFFVLTPAFVPFC
ncbi:hypothetical protein H5410_003817 [Solanum commersonii]|uniref:Uncharacterized protein n=1 Tax=Solanum commersonii TaxID=4109 RepID=A0A9J6B687_SOLCO|nr:hypothetical protein H5410_003817 [Solanum commersonii]